MKNELFFILFFCIASSYAQATMGIYTTEDEAVAVATNTIKMRGIHPSTEFMVYAVPCGDHVALYEVVFASGQSVIVSGHKVENPVVAVNEYANGISYFQHPEEYPAGYHSLLDRVYSLQTFCHDKSGSDSIYQVWNTFLSNSTNLSRSPIIGPYLTTRWRQSSGVGCGSCSSDYNKYMPLTDEICNGDTLLRSPTGCTVTAIGQVMNYWKFPVLRSDKPRQIDWCNMPDSIYCASEGGTPVVAREAVAHLMNVLGHDLGVIYGPDFGFLDPAVALITLQMDYGYSFSAECLKRSNYETEWRDLILNEIVDGRPVIYWAFDENNPLMAHTFVCDGYNPNDGTFHFNWGHGTAGDWVALSDIYESGNAHWNDYQWAIINFEPGNNGDFCDGTVWLSAFYGKFYRTHHTYEYPPYTVVPGIMAYLYSADVSSNSIYRTIPSGATAMYQAHEEIVLQDGFTVEAGAEFTAEIVPCPNCEGSRDATGNADGVAADEPAEMMAPSRRTPEPPQPQADLYPNPTSGEVTVSVEGEVQSVVILNMMGQPVGGWGLRAMEPGRVTIDVGPLPAGPYLVCVHTPHGTATKKLLVGTE